MTSLFYCHALCIFQEWHDARLQWDPDRAGKLRKLYLPADTIWLPDLAVQNTYVDHGSCSHSILKGNLEGKNLIFYKIKQINIKYFFYE